MRLIIGAFFLVSICFGQTQQISVESVNTETVGMYEKFEIIVTMENVIFSNPYDPDEIDVAAVFTAPSGKTWRIYGFYDNYNSINKWKVRFAPNETGVWSYRLELHSPGGEAQSTDYSFTATVSGHHGWLRISPVNRHYFIYDDGTPFYGIGPYYPWRVTNDANGLAQLEASGCNFYGYWNIMYDTGGGIIESMTSGLGRYDQPKCGRIDQLISWSEERNLKMMLAIWPHDLFCNSLTGWAKQWANNPYKTVCDVSEIYSDATAWEYQKKQYRYIIARWGYSRALGVWEIINEINGTDAWVAGKEVEALQWTGRVSDYLKANDPHGRPTTASMSGGQYWPQGYAEVDIPNVHMYETGWAAKYPANAMRSSANTYYRIAYQLWNDFNKPAIFGEAGSLNSYGDYPAGSVEYTTMFHNALWASWCGGLAVTPAWWDFGSKQIMTADVMKQMQTFSQVVRDYDYAYQNFTPYEIIADGCDVYAMRSDSSVFGWVREAYGGAIGGHILLFKNLEDTSYQITWYNTWTAEIIDRNYVVGLDTLVIVPVPESAGNIADVAFFLEKTAEGDTPARLLLRSTTDTIYVRRNEQAQMLCTIHDADGRFVRIAVNTIDFRIEGPGRFLGPEIVDAVNGIAGITFTDDSTCGPAEIIAESPGLIPDTLIIDVTNRISIDTFESYGSDTNLMYVWHARAGTTAEMALTGSITGNPGTSLRIDYTIGDGNAPYAGVYRVNPEDLTASEYLEFWFQGDASGRTLALLIFELNGRYWQYDRRITGNQPEFLRIPLSDFTASDTAGSIKLDEVDEISFNILKNDGDPGDGTFYLDEISLVIPAAETAVERPDKNITPGKFSVSQNYPNPFNNSTTISYILPESARVTVEIFDPTGRVVEKLLAGSRQSAGRHQIRWQNSRLASGIYFYRIRAGAYQAVKKCLLIK